MLLRSSAASPEVAGRTAVLRNLARSVNGMLFAEAPSANMLRAPLAKVTAPMTTSRCDIEVGPWLRIPVWTFKAADEAKLPSTKPVFVDTDEETGKQVVRNVKKNTEYKKIPPAAGGNPAEGGDKEPLEADADADEAFVSPDDVMSGASPRA